MSKMATKHSVNTLKLKGTNCELVWSVNQKVTKQKLLIPVVPGKFVASRGASIYLYHRVGKNKSRELLTDASLIHSLVLVMQSLNK